MNVHLRAALLASLLIPLAACFFQGEGNGVPTTALFLKKVSSPGNALAIFHPDDDLPPPNGGPTGQTQGPDSADAGTTVEIGVFGTSSGLSAGGVPFDRVFVSVAGATGHYEIVFPGQVTSTQILLTLDEDVPAGADSLTVNFELGDFTSRGQALVGVPFSRTFDIDSPGVLVTLTWQNPGLSASNLDLEVEEPCGYPVFPGGDPSPFGGSGDFDANSDCEEDVSEENVSWPAGMAPEGTFTVRVSGDDCGVSPTPFALRIRTATQVIVHTGSLACSDGCDTETFTFDVAEGPKCQSTSSAPGSR